MDIIVNLDSGKGNGRACLEKATAYLDERGVAYTVHATECIGHAEKLARELSADGDGQKIIVACGGDGTFHEVLNGIDPDKVRLGLIPAGRGNDFARGTGFAASDPVEAVGDIVRGELKTFDYIQVSDRRCLNIAGTGMDVDVLLKTAKSHNKLTYVASLFKCLLKFKPYKVSVSVNGQTYDTAAIMVGVCNGSQFGSGIQLSPLAKADDGKLELMIIRKPRHTPTLLLMPNFVKGKHVGKSYSQQITCDSVHIETTAPLELDGEIYYNLAFDAKIVPAGIRSFARKQN